jgi:outer membrane receptor protein involved in Fe transport
VTFNKVTEGNGSSFSANLEKSFDAAKISGFASRETNPSGSGLVETDKFGVSLNKRLTEAMTGSVDAILYRTKYISLTYPGSWYYTFEPKLNWRFTEWWTLDAGYRYARYEPESAAAAITSNAVYLNLAYNWPKIAVSR